MSDYLTIAANLEATGAALTASEPMARLIHRPHPTPRQRQRR
jgi:hypothetical protein